MSGTLVVCFHAFGRTLACSIGSSIVNEKNIIEAYTPRYVEIMPEKNKYPNFSAKTPSINPKYRTAHKRAISRFC